MQNSLIENVGAIQGIQPLASANYLQTIKKSETDFMNNEHALNLSISLRQLKWKANVLEFEIPCCRAGSAG